MFEKIQLWLAKLSFASIRVDFYEDLAEALDDNAALVDEIQKLADRAEEEKDVTAPLFKLWLRRMDDRSFPLALIDTVPDSDVMILESAEASGNLSAGLRFLNQSIEAANQMKTSLRGAVMGFVFFSSLIVGLLFAYSFYGISIIEQVVPPDAWPWVGQVLRDTAHFVTDYAWYISGIGISGTVLYLWSLPNWRGSLRVKADRYLPFYSIYRDFNSAKFRVMMAALMTNKVSLTEALDKISQRASPWLQWHIRSILFRLDYESDQPAKAFDTGIFSKRDTWRFIDYGERNSFPVAVGKLGLQSMKKVTESVSRSAQTINKLLLLVSGCMMAFIIVGTLLTVYEAQNAVQRQLQAVTPK